MNVRKFENDVELKLVDLVVWRKGSMYGGVVYVGKFDPDDYEVFHVIRFETHVSAPNMSDGGISDNTYSSVPLALEALKPDEVIVFKNWKDLGFFLSQNL